MVKKLSRRQFVKRSTAAAGVIAAGLGAPAIVKAASEKWGDLVGRFVYDGTAPERKKLKVDKDVACCGKFDIRDESLMVGADGSLANVYVYLRTRNIDICPELEEMVADHKQVLLENRDCIFVPHCLKIWYTKQEFYTTNSQPIADNVAFSPLGDRPANIILPPAPDSGDEVPSATWKFRRRQNVPVPIACNYHPWESAYVLPRENPYVEVSKTDGTFRVAKLPVGPLQFQLWHEKVGYLHTPQWIKGRFNMTIKPGVNELGTVKVDPSWLRVGSRQ